MSVELFKIIQSYQNGDSASAWRLVQKFRPLLKHYAYLACKEDAFEDLQCAFLSLLKNLPLDKLTSHEDGVIINYIKKSVRNAYISISKDKGKEEIVDFIDDLPTPATIDINKRNSQVDSHESLILTDMRLVLTKNEYNVLYQLYFEQRSVSEIAMHMHKTRQAINQTKINALKKLKAAWG